MKEEVKRLNSEYGFNLSEEEIELMLRLFLSPPLRLRNASTALFKWTEREFAGRTREEA